MGGGGGEGEVENVEEDLLEEEQEEMDEFDRIENKQMKAMVHDRLDLRAMFNEYYGMEEYENIPIEDGFDGLEIKYKNKWRKGFPSKDVQKFTRIKRIANAIKVNGGIDMHYEKWQPILRKGLATLHDAMQKDGLIPKGKERKARRMDP